MREVFLIVLLSFASSNAMAEWVGIWNLTGLGNVYADPSTIRKVDSKAKMWILMDVNSPLPFIKTTAYSEISLAEFDCTEEKSRTTKALRYAERMGKGNVVSIAENQNSQWEIVAPHTMDSELLDFACSSTLSKFINKAKTWMSKPIFIPHLRSILGE